MLLESRKSVSYESLLAKAVGKIEQLGYSEIRADLEDYEKPFELKGKTNDINFVPDLTARKGNSKTYFEISQKVEDTRELVNKWKLLETLSKMKNGNFKIFVPHGQMKFTQELIEQHQIRAELEKI
ncbi:hypothetical protein [Marinoscillum sp. MHG1-6]|uniref:hypothetical protein n=1 Tax=Marinoscillum sp. MHG1-6 TaxID=2959627 RepID=UPI002157BE61|nr:hypothetical protein [Marinoscillum sp. MHG1-6]